MKLSEKGPGVYRIEEVKREKLKELGFVKGREVEVLVNRRGKMIVMIEGEKFAIDKKIAEGVEVD